MGHYLYTPGCAFGRCCTVGTAALTHVTTRRLAESDLSVVWNQDYGEDSATVSLDASDGAWVARSLSSVGVYEVYASSNGAKQVTTLTHNDLGSMAIHDGSDNIYIVGLSTGSGGSISDTIRKYNSSQVFQWGETDLDWRIDDVTIDSSGDIVVLGSVENFSPAPASFKRVGKYPSGGTASWVTNPLSTDAANWGECVATDSSDNIYIGNSYSSEQLVKLNTSGVVQWRKASNSGNTISGIGVDGSGNVWTAEGGISPTIAKYDSSGTYQSSFASALSANRLLVDASGDIVVVGANSGTWECAKYDTSGTELAKFSHGSDTGAWLYDIRQMAGGDYIVTGTREPV